MYFITVFINLDFGLSYVKKRTWGFYTDKDVAISSLNKNLTDMNEGIYKYALIEKIPEGICQHCSEREWFKFDTERDGYFAIEEPVSAKIYSNFAIG